MAVYVDDMKAEFRRSPFARKYVMCHMIADDEADLHAMADRIGVKRKWFQGDHYDVTQTKRALAVKAGAIEITWREAGRVMVARRRGLKAEVALPTVPPPQQGALPL